MQCAAPRRDDSNKTHLHLMSAAEAAKHATETHAADRGSGERGRASCLGPT